MSVKKGSVTAPLDKAEAGDLVVGFYGDRSGIVAIEQVNGEVEAVDIVNRWVAQQVGGGGLIVELWTAQAGFYYVRAERE